MTEARPETRNGVFLAGGAAILAALVAFAVVPLAGRFSEIHRMPPAHDWVHYGLPAWHSPAFFWVANLAFAVVLVAFVRGRRPTMRLTVGVGLTLTALALVVPPVTSFDIYAYSFYGKVQAVYHANPYLVTPSQFTSDPWYAWWPWRDMPAVYGPVFLGFLRLLVSLTMGTLLATVVALKVASTAALVCGTLLLTKAVPPGVDRRWPVLLLLWNPMAILAVGVGAHVDGFLVLLVGAALYAHRKVRPGWAFAALCTAGSVKIYLLALPALYAVWWLSQAPPERRLRLCSRTAAVGALLVAGPYIPYWRGTRTLRPIVDVAGGFTASPAGFVRNTVALLVYVPGMHRHTAFALAAGFARSLAVAAVLAAFVWACVRLRREREPWKVIATYSLAYFFAAPWVYYWHTLPLVVIVACLPWSPVTAAALLLGGFLVNDFSLLSAFPKRSRTVAWLWANMTARSAARYLPAAGALLLRKRPPRPIADPDLPTAGGAHGGGAPASTAKL